MLRRSQQFFSKNFKTNSQFHLIPRTNYSALSRLSSFSEEHQKQHHQKGKQFNVRSLKYGGLLIALNQATESNKETDNRKTPLKTDKTNCVLIRIWLARIGNVGHVSLQTFVGGLDGKGIYASFWPSRRSTSFFKKFNSLGTCLVESPEIDIRKEKRHPDIIVRLYSLDITKINSDFIKFKQSNYNWSLLGGWAFTKEKNKNCVDLVELLLSTGGIGNLIDPAVYAYYTIVDNNQDIRSMLFLINTFGTFFKILLGLNLIFYKPNEKELDYIYLGILTMNSYYVSPMGVNNLKATLIRKALITTPFDVAALAMHAQETENRKFKLIPCSDEVDMAPRLPVQK